MKIAFCHTFAGYRCTKCGETYERHGGTSTTIPHLVVAFVFAGAFSLRLIREPWGLPWYCFFGIYAGELLLFFASGFPLSVIGMLGGRHSCKKCKAPALLSGRYFNYGQKPWVEVYVIFSVHTVLNVVIWLNLVKLLTS